jgi:antitoxin HicB
MVAPKNPHDGSTLDSFLKEEGILEHTKSVALKRVIAYRLLDILAEENLTQAELARRMNTSKAAINRLLNPNNTSVTLHTLLKAIEALGKTISVSID